MAARCLTPQTTSRARYAANSLEDCSTALLSPSMCKPILTSRASARRRRSIAAISMRQERAMPPAPPAASSALRSTISGGSICRCSTSVCPIWTAATACWWRRRCSATNLTGRQVHAHHTHDRTDCTIRSRPARRLGGRIRLYSARDDHGLSWLDRNFRWRARQTQDQPDRGRALQPGGAGCDHQFYRNDQYFRRVHRDHQSLRGQQAPDDSDVSQDRLQWHSESAMERGP